MRLVYQSLNLAIILFLCSSCCEFTDTCDEDQTSFDYFNDYISDSWESSSVLKCDTIDVSQFYSDFVLTLSYESENIDGGHIFNYTAVNGEPAFPDNGTITFEANTEFNTTIISGIRDDNVEVLISGLPNDFSQLPDASTLNFETIGNADCTIINGRTLVKPRYVYSSRRR